MGAPNVKLLTKWPSCEVFAVRNEDTSHSDIQHSKWLGQLTITSTCSQSAPRLITFWLSSASMAKSAERMDGEIMVAGLSRPAVLVGRGIPMTTGSVFDLLAAIVSYARHRPRRYDETTRTFIEAVSKGEIP